MQTPELVRGKGQPEASELKERGGTVCRGGGPFQAATPKEDLGKVSRKKRPNFQRDF